MSIEEMSCGVITTDKPFSYEKTLRDVFVIYYNLITQATMCGLKEKEASAIVESLNDAYQKGYAKCGSELMPEIAGKSNKKDPE